MPHSDKELEEIELVEARTPGLFMEPGGGESDTAPRYFTRARDSARFYKEYQVNWQGEVYRYWNPHRSKWAVHIGHEEVRDLLGPELSILYLGAATGTSLSHLGDLVTRGPLFAIELSRVSLRRLNQLGAVRDNIFPILADASRPEEYQDIVSPVKLLYMDVSQANQLQILSSNAALFLEAGGAALVTIKERSISLRPNQHQIREEIDDFLTATGRQLILEYTLQPYDNDHLCFLIR